MVGTNELKWKRPELLDYPRVWATFLAKDINSDQLAEYRIEDLPESRYEEAITTMAETFCRDDPLMGAYEVINDRNSVENFKMTWRSMITQKMSLVCFKNGSNEIVGLNIIYVSSKDDQLPTAVNLQCERRKKVDRIVHLLYENFDVFEQYDVDKYLGDFGLLVTPAYRGRGIGEQFLKVRRDICKEFGINLISTVFTSNYSNRLADKVGFKLDVSLSFSELRGRYPDLDLPEIKSNILTLKSIVC